MTERQLEMSFDLNTIDHLGIKMYSRIPNAMAELIANAYDADASQVHVKLYDDKDEKRIEIIDDGSGMDFDEINDKFLRIGRNRRDHNLRNSPKGRKAAGKKGLGKLALFGIGDLIEVKTIKENSGARTCFTLSWEDLKNTSDGEPYSPTFDETECDSSEKGTTIVLKGLKRKSSFNKEELAASLSKLFNYFDSEFKCFITLNDDDPIEVNNALRAKNIDEQFSWEFPEFSNKLDTEYAHKHEVTGKIISTEKPLKPGLRGVTLFANGRLVSIAGFFDVPESSHVFSYLTGWLNVDFIDDIEPDVISTDRQSLSWEHSDIVVLRNFLVIALRGVIREWRDKRTKTSKKKVLGVTGINVEQWLGTLQEPIKSNIKSVIENITNDPEASTEKQEKTLKELQKLIPEYAQYHLRLIHPKIQDVSEEAYKNEDYYTAFFEAVKCYINTVRRYSGVDSKMDDTSMMGEVFGDKKRRLCVTENYKLTDDTFGEKTLANIENGQRGLSQGVVQGCRNPLAHEEKKHLRESGLFSEKDCLDALSILSHLFRRLDDAIEYQRQKGQQQ